MPNEDENVKHEGLKTELRSNISFLMVLTLIALNLKIECSNSEFRPIPFDKQGVFLQKYENVTNSITPDQRALLGPL